MLLRRPCSGQLIRMSNKVSLSLTLKLSVHRDLRADDFSSGREHTTMQSYCFLLFLPLSEWYKLWKSIYSKQFEHTNDEINVEHSFSLCYLFQFQQTFLLCNLCPVQTWHRGALARFPCILRDPRRTLPHCHQRSLWRAPLSTTPEFYGTHCELATTTNHISNLGTLALPKGTNHWWAVAAKQMFAE